jgi:hypothetical protein
MCNLILSSIGVILFVILLTCPNLEAHNIRKRAVVAVSQRRMKFECAGSITLLSSQDASEIKIKSRSMYRVARKRNGNKKSVKRKIKRRGMRFAKVIGNCCWEVREQYHGGETKELWRAHTYQLPWSIRTVKMISC